MGSLHRAGLPKWRPSNVLVLVLYTKWYSGNKVSESSSNSLELPAVAVVAELRQLLALLGLLCLRGLLVLRDLRGLHVLAAAHVGLLRRRALRWVVVGPAAG